MNNQKGKYLLFGIVIAILFVVFISAGDDQTENGRYQIAAEQTALYIVDTRTGIVKRVFEVGLMTKKQFGIPFDQMKNE